MVVRCNVCNVECSTEESLQCHIRGRKHKTVVSELEERKRQAKSSVFVRGFPRQITEEDIRQYFSRFGDVVQVMMEDKKDLYAFVEFASVEAKEKAVRQKLHYVDNNKIVVKQKTFNENNFKKYRHNLQIRKTYKGDKSKVKDEIEDPLPQSEVTSALSGAVSITDQMQRLCQCTRMTDAEINIKRQLCLMLEEVLARYFPGCTVHQFGSSVNGFGVRGCDADIYFNIIPWDDKTQEPREPVKLPYVRDIRSLKKSHGPLTTADLDPLTSYDKVRLVLRILCEHAPGCNNLIAIPSARVPVVRFVHEPTNIKCDISLNNRIALKNSQLLWLYSCLDDRVCLLVYTIRYWAKVKEIAGSGAKLSNYALTLTVIYFLQNTTPPVLPTVEHLASMVPADSQDIINDWNCSFASDLSRLEKSSNQDSAGELLMKYFEFYSKQDFSTTVFQLHTASAKSVSEFLSQYEMSGPKSPFKIGHISVQDPFVLEHNITANVNGEKKMKICTEFTIAACKSSKWLKSMQLDDNCTGLISLLSDDIPPEILNKCNLAFGKIHMFQIVFKETHLLRTMPSPGKPSKFDSHLDWCSRVIQFSHNMLSDVMYLSVESLAPTDRNEDTRISEQTTQECSTVKEISTEHGLKQSEADKSEGQISTEHGLKQSGSKKQREISMEHGLKHSEADKDEGQISTERGLKHSETNKDEISMEHGLKQSEANKDEVSMEHGLKHSETNKDEVFMEHGLKQSEANKHVSVKTIHEMHIKPPRAKSSSPTDKNRRGHLKKRLLPESDSRNKKMKSDNPDVKTRSSSENVEVNLRDVEKVNISPVFVPEARKRHSSNPSDDMEVKKFCLEEIDITKNNTGTSPNLQVKERNKLLEKHEIQTGSEFSSSSLSSAISVPTTSSEDSNSKLSSPQVVINSAQLNSLKVELLCKSHFHTWKGRNKFRKLLLESGANVDLNLERAVSQKVIEKNSKSKHVLGFRCKFDPVVAGSTCVVNATIVATENQSECQTFVSFFKSFIIKMVDRHLNAETLTNPIPRCLKRTVSPEPGCSVPNPPVQISADLETSHDVQMSSASQISHEVQMSSASQTSHEVQMSSASQTSHKVQMASTSQTSHEVQMSSASQISHKVQMASTSQTSHEVQMSSASQTSHKVQMASTSQTSHEVQMSSASQTSHEVQMASTSQTNYDVQMASTSQTSHEVEMSSTSQTSHAVEKSRQFKTKLFKH